MPDELLAIETDAAGDELDASVWGIRFELLCLGLGGVGVSVLIIAGLAWHSALGLVSAVFAGLPAAAALSFVWFKQAHPPGYDLDLLDLWLHGPGFGPKPPEESDELS